MFCAGKALLAVPLIPYGQAWSLVARLAVSVARARATAGSGRLFGVQPPSLKSVRSCLALVPCADSGLPLSHQLIRQKAVHVSLVLTSQKSGILPSLGRLRSGWQMVYGVHVLPSIMYSGLGWVSIPHAVLPKRQGWWVQDAWAKSKANHICTTVQVDFDESERHPVSFAPRKRPLDPYLPSPWRKVAQAHAHAIRGLRYSSQTC